MRRTMSTLAFAGVLVLASCSRPGGGAPAPGDTATASPPVSTSSVPAPTTAAPTRPTPAGPPPGPSAPGPAGCPAPGWGTGAKAVIGSTTGALYQVRVGRHDCYDRVVFAINGPAATGYSARYVPQVTADASGRPLPVPGGAVLQVVIHAPAQGADEGGHQPGRILAATGDQLYSPAQLASWPSLRAVRFAGSFEGQCTFAAGTRTKLPFRLFALLDAADQVRLVVLDIAH